MHAPAAGCHRSVGCGTLPATSFQLRLKLAGRLGKAAFISSRAPPTFFPHRATVSCCVVDAFVRHVLSPFLCSKKKIPDPGAVRVV